jgi:hypothetical protein
MNIEIIQDTTVTIKAVNMHPGQIGKVIDTIDELYVVRQESGFIKIWLESNSFETAPLVPASWLVRLLPESTVVKLTF